MEREDWVFAIRHSIDDLFIESTNILACFMSTGHRFESILSRNSDPIVNIPQIYDSSRDLTFSLKKIFELTTGSTAVYDYEIEGESFRFNSYRIGFQRRVNFLTSIEFSKSYLLKFISGTLQNFPEQIIGSIGNKETSLVQWFQGGDIPEFLMRSALADANSLLERSFMDMNIGTIKNLKIATKNNNHKFLINLTEDEQEILLIEENSEYGEWITRLVNLFSRYSNDSSYSLPLSVNQKFDQAVLIELSVVIMRRFLSYLVPPKKNTGIKLEKVSQITNISVDLLEKFFEENLADSYEKFGLLITKNSKNEQEIMVDKLSRTRVISGSLMEVNRYYDQFVAKLPSKLKSASNQKLELQNTIQSLGKIWGSFVYGSLIGESDKLFILYNEILIEVNGLNESRLILQELKQDVDDPDIAKANKLQRDLLRQYLEGRLKILNENITKFISLVVESYMILLKTILVPKRIKTTKKTQDLNSQVSFEVSVNNIENISEKIYIFQDEPKDWLILVFFSYILSQNKEVDIFLKSLGPELNKFYESIEKTWDSLQLLTLESSDEEWNASIGVNKLFIKPTRRRNMVTKILNLT